MRQKLAFTIPVGANESWHPLTTSDPKFWAFAEITASPIGKGVLSINLGTASYSTPFYRLGEAGVYLLCANATSANVADGLGNNGTAYRGLYLGSSRLLEMRFSQYHMFRHKDDVSGSLQKSDLSSTGRSVNEAVHEALKTSRVTIWHHVTKCESCHKAIENEVRCKWEPEVGVEQFYEAGHDGYENCFLCKARKG